MHMADLSPRPRCALESGERMHDKWFAVNPRRTPRWRKVRRLRSHNKIKNHKCHILGTYHFATRKVKSRKFPKTSGRSFFSIFLLLEVGSHHNVEDGRSSKKPDTFVEMVTWSYWKRLVSCVTCMFSRRVNTFPSGLITVKGISEGLNLCKLAW